MKQIAFVLIALMGCLLAVNAAPDDKKAADAGPLQHVVILKFKSTATPADIKKVETAFVALKKKIPQVTSLKWGTNVSPENLAKGFTHCFVLTFKSGADRDAYLVHPEHKAFGSVLGPFMDDVLVIDFKAQD